jgi:hypothetical protein
MKNEGVTTAPSTLTVSSPTFSDHVRAVKESAGGVGGGAAWQAMVRTAAATSGHRRMSPADARAT